MFFSISSLSVAILTLAFPAKLAASLSDAQEKNRASPSLRLNKVFISRDFSIPNAFAIGPLAEFSLKIIYPIPGAPSPWAQLFILSATEREPQFGPGTALTTDPFSIDFAKIVKPEFLKISVTS